jgi:hypothetical protein
MFLANRSLARTHMARVRCSVHGGLVEAKHLVVGRRAAALVQAALLLLPFRGALQHVHFNVRIWRFVSSLLEVSSPYDSEPERPKLGHFKCFIAREPGGAAISHWY